jgi:hypothetical protein
MAALAQIAAVAMAPDASWAVTVARNGTVRTLGTGIDQRTIRRAVAIDGGAPVAVALSGNRLRVLSAAQGTIRLGEHVRGALPRQDSFTAPTRVTALALSPSGRLAAVACDDRTLRCLDVGSGEFSLPLASGTLTVRAVAVASDQGPVVAAFTDGSVCRYDLATGTSDLVGVRRGIRLVAITPDGTVVITPVAGTLLRWEPSHKGLPGGREFDLDVAAVAVDGTGDKVLAATANGGLLLLDFVGNPPIKFGREPAPVPPPPGGTASTEIRRTTADAPPAAAGDVTLGTATRWLGSDSGGIVDNDVRFTVYRPQALLPGVWASLLVFAHKTNLVIEPGRPPVDPSKQVEAMARAHFGRVPVPTTGEDARTGVFRGARLRVVVDLPGIRCNPPEIEFDWWEPVHQATFRLFAPPGLIGSVVRGAVRIWCGPLLIGEVSLAISITENASTAQAPAVTESAGAYRKIFPSYSHKDRAIVDGFAELARVFGDHYLQDVLALRSGERWRDRLPELIEEADIFQLFWSSNSMRSPYCRQEWEHALTLERPLFVRPLFWENPMPEDPAMGLPPAALKELDFVQLRPFQVWTGRPSDRRAVPADTDPEAMMTVTGSFELPSPYAELVVRVGPAQPLGSVAGRVPPARRSRFVRRTLVAVLITAVIIVVLVSFHVFG